MIQQQTVLKILDNSGAKTAKCIKVLGGFKKRYAKLGDFIIVSIQELRNKSKVTSKIKKGEVHLALIIQTKYNYKNKDGSIVNFSNSKNAVVLVNKKGNPIASRILEPIPSILKKKKLIKIISISPGLF